MNSLCQTCRKLLYRTDLCRGDGVECGRTDGGSKKSTAALMEVPRKATEAGRVHPVRTGIEPEAGTQAPPVDTKLGRPRDTGPSQGKSKRAAQMREYQRKRRANKKAKEAAK